MNPSVGDRPRCWLAFAVTVVRGAGTCADKTASRLPSRGRSFPAAGYGGRWKGLCACPLAVARIAGGLGVSLNTANKVVFAEGRRVVIDDPRRFEGVKVIGVDEHVWRHARRGDEYVTVIIDLTSIRNKTGLSHLLDMVEGRSKQVFTRVVVGPPTGVAGRGGSCGHGRYLRLQKCRRRRAPGRGSGDGSLPCDPFGRDALDVCGRRVQQATCGHCGRAGDPLYKARQSCIPEWTDSPAPTTSQRVRHGYTRRSGSHLGASTSERLPPTGNPTVPTGASSCRWSSISSNPASRLC